MTTENIEINIREDGSRVVIRSLNEVGDASENASNKHDKLNSSMTTGVYHANRLYNAFRLLATALLANEFVKMADAATLMEARLRLITKSTTELGEAQNNVYRISQQYNVGLKETTNLYVKLFEPISKLGGGTKEVTGIVDAFTASLKISGASTQETAAATLQFAQAMSSGRLQGDEFRSMAENSPRFMKALADGLDVPVGKLKEMSSEGKLTADVIGNELLKSLTRLKEEAAGLSETTVSGALTRWHNDAIVATDDFNKLTGTTGSLIDFVTILSGITKELGNVFKNELKDGSKVAESSLDIVAVAGRIVGTVIETLIVLYSDFSFIVKGIGREIGGIGAQAVALAKGDFSAVAAIRKEMVADSENSRAELDRYQARILGMTDKVLQARKALQDGVKPGDTAESQRFSNYNNTATLKAIASDKDLIDTKMRLEGINKSYMKDLNTLQAALEAGTISQNEYVDSVKLLAVETWEKSRAGKAAAEAAKVEESDYVKLIKQINERTAVEKQSIEVNDKLTTGQKFAVKVMADMRDGTINFVATQQLSITKQKQLLAAGLESYLQAEQYNKLREENRKADEDMLDVADKDLKTINDLIKAREIHNSQIGKTKAEIENLANLRMLESAATDEQTAAQIRNNAAYGGESQQALLDYADKLEQIALAKRKAAGLYTQGDELEQQKAFKDRVEAQAKKYENAFNASSRKIQDGLYDAISNGGGQAAKKLVSDLKNWFARLVLNPIIQPIGNFGAGIVQSAFGANAVGGEAGGSNTLSNLLTGKTIYDAFAGASATAGASFNTFAFSSLGKTLGLSSEFAGIGAGQAGLSSLGQLGSTLASAAPYIAAAVAAFSILKSGLSMGEKQITGSNVTGTLGTENIARNVNWAQEGGFLRGNRSGTWSYNLATSVAMADGVGYTDTASLASDKALLKVLNDGYTTLKTATVDYAKVLGLNADNIMARNDEMSFTIGKTSEETQTNITNMFKDIGNKIAETVITPFASLAKEGEKAGDTLTRLATEVTTVDGVVSALGLTFSTGMMQVFQTADATFSKFVGYTSQQLVEMKDALIQVSGGLEKFLSQSSYFAQNFLTDAEKIKPSQDQVAKLFAQYQITNVATIEDYKKLVQSQDLSTESGRALWAALMELAPVFKQVADYANSGANSSAALAEALLRTNQSIQAQIDALLKSNMTTEQIRAAELAGAAESTAVLLRRLYALQDEKTAAAEAAAALEAANAKMKAIQAEAYNLDTRWLELTGNTTELRKRELALLDPSNRAKQESIWLEEDRQAAEKLAQQAAQQAIQAAQQSAQQAAQAAEQLRQAWQSTTDSILAQVAKLRGLTTAPETNYAQAESQFAIMTARARAGDQEAAKALPQLAETLSQLAEINAVTSAELRAIRNRIAGNLETTAQGFTQYGVTLPSFDVGTNYVPYDMIAQIHKGEKITPAAYNGDAEEAMLQLISDLRAEMAGIRIETAKVAKNTESTSEILDEATKGGRPVQVKVTT